MKKDKILVYFCEKLVLLIMYKYYKIIFCFLLLGSFAIAQNLIPNQSTWTIKNDDEGGSLTIFLDESLETLLKEKEAAICDKTGYAPPVPLTPAEKCAKQNKILGYKIQIFYTKDRDTANRVKNDFASQHPDMTPELIYASPDYRILVGDYFTRQSASDDLRRIQRNYPGAFAIQYRIWCRKAK